MPIFTVLRYAGDEIAVAKEEEEEKEKTKIDLCNPQFLKSYWIN